MPSFDVENSPAPESLGEIARRYRSEKAQREAEEAAKSLSPSLFRMNLTAPTFAAPVQPPAPLAPPKTLPWKNPRPAARVAQPSKRDPFAPQIAAPALRNSRPDLSSKLPVPSRPAVPLTPHAPAMHVAPPAVTPSLDLPAASVPAQAEIRTTAPRRPGILHNTSAVAPAVPNSHSTPFVAPSLGASAPRPTPLSVAPQTRPVAPTVAPHTAIVAPALPQSHTKPVAEPSMSLPSAAVSVAPSLAPNTKPVAPSIQLHTIVPAAPKSHTTFSPTPNVNLPSRLVAIAPSLAPQAKPGIPELAPHSVVAPRSASRGRMSPIPAPNLFLPAAPKTRPPALAHDPEPVAPSVAVSRPIASPSLPAPATNGAPTPVPSVVAPSAPIPAPPGFAPHTSLIVPPAERSSNTLLIQPGDSLWKLARRRLGKGSRWSEFLATNPSITDPALIQPGTVLVVPTIQPHSLLLRPPNTFAVRTGDSLWELAASHLGKGTAWTCIAAANPQLQDANRLYPGQLLTLPSSCPR
jgi:nucleoid-associated protein YgaU